MRKRKKPGCFFLMLLLQVVVMQGSSQEVKRPPITGIAFVQLQVSDVKKSRVFYTSLLGYDIVAGKPSAVKTVHSFHIAVSARQSIELAGGLPAGQDERLVTLAFQTTDATALYSYLKNKGIEVPAVINKQYEGMLSFTVHDPDNHPVTFVQFTSNVIEQPKKTIQDKRVSHRILHAGLTVGDIQVANAFYMGILGFSEIWRGGTGDSITSWINMRVPDGTDYLEYMLVSGPVNRQQLGSMHHIALMVPDMQQALDILNVRSVHNGYLVAPPRIGRNNRWQLNLFDPDGTRIELMEPFTMR